MVLPVASGKGTNKFARFSEVRTMRGNKSGVFIEWNAMEH